MSAFSVPVYVLQGVPGKLGPKGDKGIYGDPGPQVSPDHIVIIMCKSVLFFLKSYSDIFQGKPGKDGVPGELGEKVSC